MERVFFEEIERNGLIASIELVDLGDTGNDVVLEKKAEYQDNGFRHMIEQIQFDSVSLQVQQLKTDAEYSVMVESDLPVVQLSFMVEGQRTYTPLSSYDPSTDLITGQHLFAYYRAVNGAITYPPETDCYCVDIVFPETYLRQVFQEDLTSLDDFGEAIVQQRSAVLGNRCYALTSRQKDTLMEMLHSPFSGSLKKLFLEGKLYELLVLQVSQYQTDPKVVAVNTFTKEDQDKLQLIRETLNQTIEQPPSLKELTILVGMNRTKLMSGFKKLFGATMYGYVADLRMDRAKELIRNDQYVKIADIARQVGFKNPNNFSAAFKKKFGYSPHSLR